MNDVNHALDFWKNMRSIFQTDLAFTQEILLLQIVEYLNICFTFLQTGKIAVEGGSEM
jgi:hypothetical protein